MAKDTATRPFAASRWKCTTRDTQNGKNSRRAKVPAVQYIRSWEFAAGVPVPVVAREMREQGFGFNSIYVWDLQDNSGNPDVQRQPQLCGTTQQQLLLRPCNEAVATAVLRATCCRQTLEMDVVGGTLQRADQTTSLLTLTRQVDVALLVSSPALSWWYVDKVHGRHFPPTLTLTFPPQPGCTCSHHTGGDDRHLSMWYFNTGVQQEANNSKWCHGTLNVGTFGPLARIEICVVGRIYCAEFYRCEKKIPGDSYDDSNYCVPNDNVDEIPGHCRQNTNVGWCVGAVARKATKKVPNNSRITTQKLTDTPSMIGCTARVRACLL